MSYVQEPINPITITLQRQSEEIEEQSEEIEEQRESIEEQRESIEELERELSERDGEMWNLRHQNDASESEGRFWENECERLKDRLRYFQNRDRESGNEDPIYTYYACNCQINCTCPRTEPRMLEISELRERNRQ